MKSNLSMGEVIGIVKSIPSSAAAGAIAAQEAAEAAQAACEQVLEDIPADYSGLSDGVAPTFSSSTAYSKGDYVFYSNALYRFTADHEAGAWTGTDAVAAVVGADVADLKSAIALIEDGMLTGYLPISLGTLIQNKYYTTAGNRVNYNGWSCTDYIELPDGATELQIDSIASSGGNYNAFYNSSSTFISNFSFEIGTNRLTIPANAKYIALSAATATMQALTLSEVLPSTDKLESGFYSLSDKVINNNWGYVAIPAIGETVDYTFTPNSNVHCGVFDVVKGDVFKITGSGGNNYRLWAFVDTTDVVLSKSASNLVADAPFIIIAPSNGKLIYTSYWQNLSIWKQAKNATEVYQKSIAQAEYDYRNRGLDVLSAFTNVSCFGDSLTASVVYTHDNGDGTHQVRSAYKKYPMILGQKIGATAESVATGGYNATDWWGAYASRIVEKENQLVVIYLGTNGGLTQTVDTDAVGDDYTQYANTNTGNYCKIVKKSLDVGAKVLLIKIHNGGGDNTFITNDAIDDVATRFNVAVVDVPFLYDRCYHAYPDNSGINGLHYNDLGYSAFAESLIRNVGALSSDMKIRLIPT